MTSLTWAVLVLLGQAPDYEAVRAEAAPRIDGVLDEPVWKRAPADRRFFSKVSKPYGQPAHQPTTVQVAYDATHLYVAFRAEYAQGFPVEIDSSMPDEIGVLDIEGVFVMVDGRHDHNNARMFGVSPGGARLDLEMADNGLTYNYEWRAVWDVATARSERGWTAELALPWGTVGVPEQEGAFEIGINFRRFVPRASENSVWAISPAAFAPTLISSFGHLRGLSGITPRPRLFLAPYLSLGYRSDPQSVSLLRDFTGLRGNVAPYGGLYARLQPPGPVRVELTVNPDFSQVTPDQARSNLDRFELFLPEVRPFFLEDRQSFLFGTGQELLFFSRRVGLRPGPTGLEDVPIVYGAKAVARLPQVELAAMNIGLADPTVAFRLDDNVTAARASYTIAGGTRVGGIFLNRAGVTSYQAAGVDGALFALDDHLVASGFLAGTLSAGQPGAAGHLALKWFSQSFQASASYLEVGDQFDPQLGFFFQTGVRRTSVSASYTPQIFEDEVRQVTISAAIDRMTTRAEAPIFTRATLSASADLLSYANLRVAIIPSEEEVATSFTLAGDRITVDPGQYRPLLVKVGLSTPPGRLLDAYIDYAEGGLFGGYQRALSTQLFFRLGRFTSDALYVLYLIRYGSLSITGHQVSARGSYAIGPLWRASVAVETNTLDPVARLQLVSAYTFGNLSTVSLALERSAGSVSEWFTAPRQQAVLSFSYGLTPL